MKVKQLIRELKKMPQNLEVEVAMHDNAEYEGSPVVSAYHVKKSDIDMDHILREDIGTYNSMSYECVIIRC